MLAVPARNLTPCSLWNDITRAWKKWIGQMLLGTSEAQTQEMLQNLKAKVESLAKGQKTLEGSFSSQQAVVNKLRVEVQTLLKVQMEHSKAIEAHEHEKGQLKAQVENLAECKEALLASFNS